MKEDLQLVTARLILRPIRSEDFDDFAAMMADPESTRFLGGPKSRFHAMSMFRGIAGGWYLDGFSCFSVFEKAGGRWVGYAGIMRREGVSSPESVAGIVRDRWAQGYVSEAATAVFDWAFDQLGFAEIVSFVLPGHAVSLKSARTMGAVFRGPIRLPALVLGEEVPVEMLSFRREQWAARSRAAERQDSPAPLNA